MTPLPAGDDSPVRGLFVVLGVCAGIAAYKVVDVCRRLADLGAHVVPVMTRDAEKFVGAMTFSALASEPARTSLWDHRDPLIHTRLADRADIIVVAPATADFLAKYAHGRADDILSATLLASRAPVVMCPAMHTGMWEHAATQDNVGILRSRGVLFVPPASGRLAGGDVGVGRLAEIDDIMSAVVETAGAPGTSRHGRDVPVDRELQGRSVLVTAGGTREPIDPVRYIGNKSSGKQGIALAREAAERGAQVVLISTAPVPATAGVEVIDVETAEQMAEAVFDRARGQDAIIMAAAVADFAPKDPAERKLAKADGPPLIELVPTVDILAGVCRDRRPGQVIVGFAAETHDVAARAAGKLHAKGADFIVANDVTEPGAGFEHDTNAVIILGADGTHREVPLSDKRKVAHIIIDAVADRLRGGGASL